MSKELHDAVRQGDATEVKNLLDKGADPNHRDKEGNTPLFGAAILGKNDALKILLACGADVNAINHYGSTPLERAVFYLGGGSRRSNKETVEALRNGGGRIVGSYDRAYYQRLLLKYFGSSDVERPGYWFVE